MLPWLVFLRPVKASTNSDWPFPSTPAIPTISPFLIFKLTPLTANNPRASWTQRSSTFKISSSGFASSFFTCRKTSLPTIWEANSAIEVFLVSETPCTSPALITVTRSAISITSLSLWVIKTTVFPSSTNVLITVNNSSVSWGVSTAVGSSNIRIFAFLYKVFNISVRCWTPTDASIIFKLGSTLNPYFSAISTTNLFSPFQSISPWLFFGSWPSPIFSGAVKLGTSVNSWWTIPIPRFIAVSTLLMTWTSPLINISPSSGCSMP